MASGPEQSSRYAVLAFRQAVGVPPVAGSQGWHDVTACVWRTPWLSSYELAATDELVLALHTGGARRVPTRTRTGWSHEVSTPGHLHLVPAGVTTAFRPEGRLEFTTIHLGPARLAGPLARNPPAFRFAFHDSFASSCVHALLAEMRAPREYGPLFVDSVTDALTLHLLSDAAPPPPARRETLSAPALSRVCERMEARLEAGVTLDELAAEAHLSRFHFARAFREAMNMPPHRYLTVRRIERAKQLLIHTAMPLSEIALAAGFSSQSHFAARFRELAGETPRCFRLRHQA